MNQLFGRVNPLLRLRRVCGFTLLELMVAIAIFAIISTISWVSFNQIQQAALSAQKNSERLSALTQAMYWLELDFKQAAMRPIRDEFGDTQAAFTLQNRAENVVELTRAGAANGLNPQQQTNLLRVRYWLDLSGTDRAPRLMRRYWSVLDRTRASEAQDSIVLHEVSAFTVRVFDDKNQEQQFWQPRNQQGEAQPEKLPNAVEITLDTPDFGKISRYFSLIQSPISNTQQEAQ